jgi:hypothetical protein
MISKINFRDNRYYFICSSRDLSFLNEKASIDFIKTIEAFW